MSEILGARGRSRGFAALGAVFVVLAGLRQLKEHPAVTGVALRSGPSGELIIGLRGVQDDREAGLLVAGVLQDPEVRSRVDGVIVSALGLDASA